MNIEISPKKVFVFFLRIILVLLFANVAVVVLKYYFNHEYVYGLSSLFDLNEEKNIPTVYSSIALFFVSVLLLTIASIQKKFKLPYFLWFGLAVVFLFLSVDEFVLIHEKFAEPSKDFFSATGALYFAWVIPYGAAVLVFIAVYFKFLMALPKRIKNLFLISGAVFVIGAIGFEMISSYVFELYGNQNITYAIVYTCEEFLEMLGIAIFIYTLFLYMAVQFESFTISFSKQK